MAKAPLSIRISGVCERDIDLLLADEFISSPEFLAWFLNQIDLNGTKLSLVKLAKSATTSNGESDLELTFSGKGNGDIRVLIENKVNAALQPRQAERYRERGKACLKKGSCSFFKTVLIAPRRYLGGGDKKLGFDATVTYEQIVSYLKKSESSSNSRIYELHMLMKAIDKTEKGWQLIEDNPISQFWQDYWEIATEIAPELQMKRPSRKPSGSILIYFSPVELPRKVELIHKVTRGCVDLQFGSMGGKLQLLSKILKEHLQSDMTIVKAAKSGAVRVKVHEINMTDDLEVNQALIEYGIQKARYLLEWYSNLKLTYGEFQALYGRS